MPCPGRQWRQQAADRAAAVCAAVVVVMGCWRLAPRRGCSTSSCGSEVAAGSWVVAPAVYTGSFAGGAPHPTPDSSCLHRWRSARVMLWVWELSCRRHWCSYRYKWHCSSSLTLQWGHLV